MFFRNCFLLCLAALVSVAPVHAAAAKKKSAGPAYKGAIVIDAATGNVLFEENADVVSPPASVTKLMTFMVVHDKLKAGTVALDTPVTITAAEANIGGTQVYLKEKEVFPVEELIYAMLIQSANDAATALARVTAGSKEVFVELMNAKARELGMTHTTFRSPHGLPPSDRKLTDSDLTTARDLSILCRELLVHTDVLKYSSVKQRDFGPARPQGPMHMINHNHLLGKIAGVDGLKTGFTNGAGFCLAATAERNGRRIITVVMGSPDKVTRDLHVGELLEKGFAALPPLPANAVPVQKIAQVSPVSPVSAAGATGSVPATNPISAANVAAAPQTTAPASQTGETPPAVVFPGTPAPKKR